MKTGERNVLGDPKTTRRRGAAGRGSTPPGSAVSADGARREGRGASSTGSTSAAGIVFADPASVAAFVRQRKDEGARAIRAGREALARKAEAISDARVRRAFERECAARDREIEGFWRRFWRRPPPQRDGVARHHAGGDAKGQRSPGRAVAVAARGQGQGQGRTRTTPRGSGLQLASYAKPVLDRQGRRGVYLSASYLSAKSASLGCARRLARYVTDLGHVEHDAMGNALTGSNVGETRTEISAAFSLVEDLNRAARANAKVVFHLIVQLPHDVTPDQRAAILRDWCEDQFGVHDLPFTWAVHTPDPEGNQRNTHGHVAVSFRPLVRTAPFTWDAAREVSAERDNPRAFRVMRERFAATMTDVCQAAGMNRVYTALSHAERGLKIKPTHHLGPHKTRLVRQGKYVAANARNRAKIARNEAMLGIERLNERQAMLEQRSARVRAIHTRSMAYPAQSRRHPARETAKRPLVPKFVRAPKAPTLPPMQSPGEHRQLSPARRAEMATPTVVQRDRSPVVTAIQPIPVISAGDARSPLSTMHQPATVRGPGLDAGRHIASVRSVQAPVFELTTFPTNAPPTAERPKAVLMAGIRGAVTTALRPHVGQDRVITVPITASRSGPVPVPIQDRAVAVIDRQIGRRVSVHLPVSVVRPQQPVSRTVTISTPALASTRPVPSFSPAAEWTVPMGREQMPIQHKADRQIVPRAAVRPSVPAPQIDAALFAAAFGEQAAKRRRRTLAARAARAGRIAAERERAILAAVGRMTWQLAAVDDEQPFGAVASLSTVAALDSIPSLDADVVELTSTTGASPVSGELADRQSQHSQLAPTTGAPSLSGASRQVAAASVPLSAAVALDDGFGGQRDTHPPGHVPTEIGFRLHAFDPGSGAPSRSLLELLRYVGERPHSVELASDGRITGVKPVPKIIAPLIDMWRHDNRVHALVVETVTASRQAGRAVWPPQHAAAIRALVPPQGSAGSISLLDKGISR